MIYKFVKRNLKLYVFWSIILLPLTTIYDIYKDYVSEEKSPLWMIIINSFRKILLVLFQLRGIGLAALTHTSICSDGYKLGNWYEICKRRYKKGIWNSDI